MQNILCKKSRLTDIPSNIKKTHFSPNGMSTAGGFTSFSRFQIFGAEAYDTHIQGWINKTHITMA